MAGIARIVISFLKGSLQKDIWVFNVLSTGGGTSTFYISPPGYISVALGQFLQSLGCKRISTFFVFDRVPVRKS